MPPPEISVVVPTHNPHRERLRRTLAGLRAQTLALDDWELLVVDNASASPLTIATLELGWRPGVRVVREDRLGLTAARLRGIEAARAELLVFVDDDNVLAPDYLQVACRTARAEPGIGAFAGRALPSWEAGPPPPWTQPFHPYLALRDLGPMMRRGGGGEFGPEEFTPNGAGMVVRTAVARAYARQLAGDASRAALDRNGQNLSSHGDRDLAWSSFPLGLEVAYVPELVLHHIIPRGRLTREYLGRLMHGMAHSGVFFQAARSGVPPPCPPAWLGLRKLRQYILRSAALSPAGYVRWRYYCGLVDGRREWHRQHAEKAAA